MMRILASALLLVPLLDPGSGGRTEVVFLGSDVPRSPEILADLLAQVGAGQRLEVVRLDAGCDGIGRIGRVLAGHHHDVAALHFITHGAPGAVALGSTLLTLDRLHERSREVERWADALAPGADLLFYGCRIAAGDGRALVRQLGALTGADVAASSDATGSSARGGNWDLEFRSGTVETPVLLSEDFHRSWPGLLPIVTFQEGVGGYVGTQDTQIRGAAPGTAYGSNTSLTVDLDDGGAEAQSLIRFDSIIGTGPGQIPPFSVINSASLDVDVTGTSNSSAIIGLHRMLVPWSEASTWNSMVNGVQTNDVEARTAADATVPDPGASGWPQTIPGLAAAVQAWANGATNLGWVLVSNDTNGWDFDSSEFGNANDRPRLTVDYTAPIDLSLTKTVDNPTPNVGNNVVFTLTISNAAGMSNATGITVKDLLPSGYSYVSDTGAGAYVPGTGVWTVGNLAAGANKVLAITAKVLPSGTYLNKSEVTAAGQTDTDSTPNNGVTTEDDYAERSTAPVARIDLSLTKTVNNATPNAGSNVVFTLTLNNGAGWSDASGVTVTDLLPSGYSYVSDTGAGAYAPGTGVWTVGGVPAGTNKVLAITAKVLGTGTYLNKAEVTSAGQGDVDSVPNNGVTTEDDYAERSTTPVPQIDLVLTKSDNPDPAPAGGELLYDLIITNNGPSTATAVTLTDVLPAGVTLVSTSSNQGSCSGTTTITCNLGGILNGGTANVQILVVTSATGTLTNSASVTATETDTVPANNSASASTTVVSGGTTDIPLTLYRRIHGFIDSTVTGGSLRTSPNTGNPCAVGASSTAALSGIPATATVIGAYLYWAGSGSTVDSQITLDAAPLTADRTFQANYVLGATNYDYFGGFKDVTAQVQAKRNGNYTFSGLTVTTGNPYCSGQAVLAGWGLFVVYQDASATGKTLVLYDGFDITRNGSTAYVLSGIYASPPPQAKASFLVWEGDETLSGASESLVFNGVAQSDALNPVNNVYNSTINTLGVTTSYGVDLDSFDVSSTVQPRDTLATATVSTGPDLVILNAVLLQVKSNVIVGTVFEDVNYGGGAGRDLATATAGAPGFSVGRPGAVVELYDSLGNLLRNVTTDATGNYGFAGLADGNYVVRAANGSVTSSRAGAAANQWPVQTFRTDASTGTAVAVTDEVGGASPGSQDAPANVTNANLGSFTAQSKAPAKIITGVAVTGTDFGFNFDTIVNRNDGGQGSLRQLLTNANALSNAGLAQSGRPAGIENAVFMLADGTARPGMNAGYPSQFVGGVATIAPASVLPTVTGPLVLDAQTEPGWSSAPIVELSGAGAGAGVSGLTVTAGGSTIRGFVINRFSDSGIVLSTNGNNTIAGNYIGTNAAGTAAAANGSEGILVDGVAGNVVGGTTASARNVLSGNTWRGVHLRNAGATGNLVQGNYVGINASGTAAIPNHIGVYLYDAPGNTVGGTAPGARNVLSGNAYAGAYMFGAATGDLVQGNLVGLDAAGTSPLGNVFAGIQIQSASGNTVGGTLAGAGNVISANGFGVSIIGTATGNAVRGNSTYGNSGLGIDLRDDGVSPNDGATNGALPNIAMDYPIFTVVTLSGSSLHVQGYVGTASTKIAGTHAIELFKADDDGNNNGPIVQGDGLSVPHGEGRWFLGSCTSAADGTFSCDLTVPGGVSLSPGDAVTGTATDSGSNTSEFAANTATVKPSIVKRAFRSDGTPLPTGTVAPKGSLVKFLLYVNNLGAAVADVSIEDPLDPAFAFVPGSIRYANSVAQCAGLTCSAAEEVAIFAAVDAGTAGSDAVDADPVSYTAATIHAGNQVVANAQLDIAPGKVWAVVFTVRVR